MGEQEIAGMSEVFSGYEGFIFDLWGVVHNGIALYPETLSVFEMLKKAQKKVWLLSNSPARKDSNIAKLAQMGLSPHLYDGITTSGEAAWDFLRSEDRKVFGSRCLYLGDHLAESICDHSDLFLVDHVFEADFLLLSMAVDEAAGEDCFLPVLKEARARDLPLICANPDTFVHVGDTRLLCAGFFAEQYEQMGGEVTYFGKPYREVYRTCFDGMGVRDVLAVGDNMATDIKGATGVGIDSILVTSGIHREDFAGQEAARFWEAYPFRPTYLLNTFCW